MTVDGSRSVVERIGPALWVIVSSVMWAAVVLSTGDVGWPLVVWALTTFAPLAEGRRRRQAE